MDLTPCAIDPTTRPASRHLITCHACGATLGRVRDTAVRRFVVESTCRGCAGPRLLTV